ncbi:MAG: DNA alkylation repair protein [Bryobacteraceae bacterium]
MTVVEVLATLETLGKPATAAIYKRHGSGTNVFGTLTSDVAKLQKKIKVDQKLAGELWKTGNAEARMLALQVSDPQQVTFASAERLLKDGQTHFLGCYLAGLISRSPNAGEIMRAWMASGDEIRREIGYSILGAVLKDKPESVSDAEAGEILQTIEREIHASPNWARYAMNGALIAIGVFKPSCRKQAIEAGRRIGKVEIDHGETTCKTPDAVPYIQKAAGRRR